MRKGEEKIPTFLDRRIVRKFLFLPRRLECDYKKGVEQWRWLEWANISQEYLRGYGWLWDKWSDKGEPSR